MNQFTSPPQAAAMYQQLPDDDFIDVMRLLRSILRYKWGILGLALVITLATGLWVYSLEPVYRASASVVLEIEEANVVSVEQVYKLGNADYEYTQTQYELLKSRSLAERVVRRLKLHHHPVFAGRQPPAERPWYSVDLKKLLPADQQEPPVQLSPEAQEEAAIQRVTSAVAAGISVKPVEYSYLIHIDYESTDPRLAAEVVNTLAEEYIGGNLEDRLSGTVQATDWLGERLEALKTELRESEQALQAFREEHGLVSVDGVTGLGGKELRSLAQRLDDARKARIEAENLMAEVQGMEDASTEALMTLPAVLQNTLIRDLKQIQSSAERKVAELSRRYGPSHPKMRAARSELDTATRELSREVGKVVSGIGREYEIAQRNEAQLQASWEASKAEMQAFNRTEFQLQELQREVDTNRELYDIFFNRIKSVSETGGFEKPHARIVDRAMVPTGPVKPNKRLSLMLALVLGTLLGCGIAVLLDILDNTVKTPEDVLERLAAPALGCLPRVPADREGNFEQFWQRPQGPYAEAVRTLRTSVMLSSIDRPARLILVTSTVAGEGKSTTALNLGSALGQMERTLVIGADLRRPRLAEACGLPAHHPGLSNLVAGTAELEDCIVWLEEPRIHLLPAGMIPPNPLEMLCSQRFAETLAHLRERFDRVVIDSAPVQAVSDALILGSQVDAVIYVVKADATSATLAERGIAQLRAAQVPLAGVLLNQFDLRKAARYYGSDYAYHYQESGAGQA